MEIKFYNCNDNRRKLEKNLLNPLVIQDIILKENNNSVSEFYINISTDIGTKNYCYIPQWNKYYFIEDKTIINNNLFRYKLKIDVLMSYRTQIKNSVLNIIQCENEFINSEFGNVEKKDVFTFRKIDIENDFFTDSNIILVVKK